MYLEEFGFNNTNLDKILHRLKKVYGTNLDLQGSSIDDLNVIHEHYSNLKNEILQESSYNSYHSHPEYAKSILICEAIRIFLSEIAPGRKNKKVKRKSKIKESILLELEASEKGRRSDTDLKTEPGVPQPLSTMSARKNFTDVDPFKYELKPEVKMKDKASDYYSDAGQTPDGKDQTDDYADDRDPADDGSPTYNFDYDDVDSWIDDKFLIEPETGDDEDSAEFDGDDESDSVGAEVATRYYDTPGPDSSDYALDRNIEDIDDMMDGPGYHNDKGDVMDQLLDLSDPPGDETKVGLPSEMEKGFRHQGNPTQKNGVIDHEFHQDPRTEDDEREIPDPNDLQSENNKRMYESEKSVLYNSDLFVINLTKDLHKIITGRSFICTESYIQQEYSFLETRAVLFEGYCAIEEENGNIIDLKKKKLDLDQQKRLLSNIDKKISQLQNKLHDRRETIELDVAKYVTFLKTLYSSFLSDIKDDVKILDNKKKQALKQQIASNFEKFVSFLNEKNSNDVELVRNRINSITESFRAFRKLYSEKILETSSVDIEDLTFLKESWKRNILAHKVQISSKGYLGEADIIGFNQAKLNMLSAEFAEVLADKDRELLILLRNSRDDLKNNLREIVKLFNDILSLIIDYKNQIQTIPNSDVQSEILHDFIKKLKHDVEAIPGNFVDIIQKVMPPEPPVVEVKLATQMIKELNTPKNACKIFESASAVAKNNDVHIADVLNAFESNARQLNEYQDPDDPVYNDAMLYALDLIGNEKMRELLIKSQESSEGLNQLKSFLINNAKDRGLTGSELKRFVFAVVNAIMNTKLSLFRTDRPVWENEL